MGKFGETVTELGSRFGVGPEVMGVVLRNVGMLEGGPGDWRATTAAAPWVNERDFTNGRHPDERQNPYFTVRQFDPEMINHINITTDDVAAAQAEVTAKNGAKWARIKAERAQADAEFLASQKPPTPAVDADSSPLNAKTFVIIGGVIIVVGVTTYLVVKHVPPVRRRWDEQVAPKLSRLAARWQARTAEDVAEPDGR